MRSILRLNRSCLAALIASLAGIASAIPGRSPSTTCYNDGQGAAPNHRYATSLAVRSDTMARGWIAEGYGDVGVIMCAPL